MPIEFKFWQNTLRKENNMICRQNKSWVFKIPLKENRFGQD